MIAVPTIIMLVLVAGLSSIGAAVVRKPWQRNVALSCAALEIAMALGLTMFVLSY